MAVHEGEAGEGEDEVKAVLGSGHEEALARRLGRLSFVLYYFSKLGIS